MVEYVEIDSGERADGGTNALTVDVEDYFQVSAFEAHVQRDDWANFDWRVADNVSRILALFDEAGVKATFFFLGCVAERFPNLLREVRDQGHEIASHGYSHVRVINQDEQGFRADVVRTKKLLEDIAGTRVIGYRAASYSINSDNLWALRVLEEEGHEYSSSIYPIRHDLYGLRDAPRFPFRLRGRSIVEIPVTTVEIAGLRFPCGGGGYFRLFPYWLFRWAVARVNSADRRPAIFYFHPWEVDPEQPRMDDLPLRTRFRHYVNLDRVEGRLRRLLSDFSWDRMDRVFGIA